MGIKNLNKLLKKEVPNSYAKVSFEELKGKVIAIDTSIFLYKFSYFQPNFTKLFWFQVKRFVDNGIIPVYVFDGAAPDAKSDTLTERKERKEQLEIKINDLKSDIDKMKKERDELKKKLNTSKNNEDIIKKIDEIDKNLILTNNTVKAKEKTNIRITAKKVKYLKKMFIEMQIPYITSNTEAEKLAAYLYKIGVVDGVMSEDSDLLPQGIGDIYKDYSLNNYYLTHISLNTALTGLDMTYEQFIDFCILCGCDYSSTLPKIGGITGLSLIKKLGNIEKILEDKKMECPNEFKYQEARKLFVDISKITECDKMMNKVENLITYIKECKNDISNINTEIDIKKFVEEFPK